MTHQTAYVLPETGFVRQKQLANIIPFSRTTLWRKVKIGEFPAPERLSANIVAWKVELIRAWIEDHSPSE
jgi:predicted DNA-binding transcriptional regulator AlpA